ncbi:Alcohol acetyltransferase [Fusarium austroafricanum]|uniref:Alcohol acetyltransferase n=1 Tax=Fusarium austroafricanum TaxID=2364996 RepID=A0A8H4KDK4_9HYPO|nr:Alcohol acetyltransferase [Fusarium austroafricanum]
MQAPSVGLDKPDILRALGPAEQYSTARSYLGIYNNVCVTATYSNRHGRELRSALFSSLSAIIRKHPILSAVPVDVSSTTTHFVRLGQIELDKIVTFVENKMHPPSESMTSHILDEVLIHEHNLPFKHDNPSIPLWRITILFNPDDLSSFTLCLCFHHSIADTQSALILHEDLGYELAAVEGNVPISAVVSTPKLELVPPLESLVILPTSADFIQMQRSLGEPSQNWWNGKRQSLPVATRFSSVWLSQALFGQLRAKCKEKSVSLTAGLISLIAGAFFRLLPPEYTVIQGDCAVSLRRFLPDNTNTRSVGCYVGSLSESYHRNCFTVWGDAARTKANIDKTITGRGANTGYIV